MRKALLSILTTLVLCPPVFAGEIKFNDPYFGQQKKYLNRMQVLEAFAVYSGTSSIVIGSVEVGYDFTHPDIKDNLLPGFKARNMNHSPSWAHTHGTVTTGIMAASANNSHGVIGLAPGCKVLSASTGAPLKPSAEMWKKMLYYLDPAHEAEMQQDKAFLDYMRQRNETSASAISDSIRYLADNGARVINLSLSMSPGVIKEAIDYAVSRDVVVLYASGNENAKMDFKLYFDPAKIILVGGSTLKDTRWENPPAVIEGSTLVFGSNYGEGLSVVAPVGGTVYLEPYDKSFYTEGREFLGGYRYMEETGTSYAVPAVSALAALIRAMRPDLAWYQVKEIIEKGADDIGQPGYDEYTGHGRVNFYKTLKLAQEYPSI